MKVAWIVYGSLEERTGGTLYDAIVVSWLRRCGHEVHLLDARTHDATSLVRAIARLEPYVVVGDELCHRELSVVFAHRTTARRVLLVHHLTCWEDELRAGPRARARFFESRAIRFADAVITTSRATRDRLVLEGCLAPIDVVLPGADRLLHAPSPRTSASIEDALVEIAFVGAMIPRKRVVDLVRALPSGARLTLVGSCDSDPRYVRAIERAIAERDLEGRVYFTGEISEELVSDALATADLFVLPSSLEGYGIAATEALDAGVPVLAARTLGLVEALSPCPAAVCFFEPRDPTSFATTLTDLVRDRARLASMKLAAASATLPTWEECGARFRSVLSPPPRPPCATLPVCE